MCDEPRASRSMLIFANDEFEIIYFISVSYICGSLAESETRTETVVVAGGTRGIIVMRIVAVVYDLCI
jgi:hypothetical protein